ncbi:hypothetical protein OH76DRAFT_1344842, partial [Lentinus brumalis]
VQLAVAIGLAQCPIAPQLEFLLGREAATQPAKDSLVPEPFGTCSPLQIHVLSCD